MSVKDSASKSEMILVQVFVVILKNQICECLTGSALSKTKMIITHSRNSRKRRGPNSMTHSRNSIVLNETGRFIDVIYRQENKKKSVSVEWLKKNCLCDFYLDNL